MAIFSRFLGPGLWLAAMGAAPAPAVEPPASVQAPVTAGNLAVGDPAPALGGVRWIKGTPVEGFKAGQVYVVEFWATWCGPCTLMMPRLSRLAREYAGRVTVIGVDILELGKDPKATNASVNAFVAEMGDRMDYNVCRDTEDGLITRTWYRAANRTGIPATFVVDGKGRIAWIGHPSHLDVVLPGILKGTFQARSFDERLEALKKVQVEYTKAYQKGDRKAALALADGLPDGDPAVAGSKAHMQLMALVHLDQERAEKAYTALERMGLANEILANALVSQEGIPNRWYVRAAGLVKEAAKRPADLYHLAEVQAKAGQKAEAVENLKQFLAFVKARQAKDPARAEAYGLYIRKTEALIETCQREK